MFSSSENVRQHLGLRGTLPHYPAANSSLCEPIQVRPSSSDWRTLDGASGPIPSLPNGAPLLSLILSQSVLDLMSPS